MLICLTFSKLGLKLLRDFRQLLSHFRHLRHGFVLPVANIRSFSDRRIQLFHNIDKGHSCHLTVGDRTGQIAYGAVTGLQITMGSGHQLRCFLFLGRLLRFLPLFTYR